MDSLRAFWRRKFVPPFFALMMLVAAKECCELPAEEAQLCEQQKAMSQSAWPDN